MPAGRHKIVVKIRDSARTDGFDYLHEGEIYDPESHSQYFYHAHRSNEHGHFHTFQREQGMPAGCWPAAQSDAAFMKQRNDKVSHLIAISMNSAGRPCALFTTNRWVTADNWYAAEDVIMMLDRFEMDLAWPSWPTNIWLTAMLRLFRPQILTLVRERDATVRD